MKSILSLAIILIASQVIAGENYNITCFYDTSSILRGGSANFTMNDLQTSLQLCTHLVYGHVGIRNGTFEVVPLDKRQLPIFQKVQDLKKKYRNVKFLLSLGGRADQNKPEKYLRLLEANAVMRQRFIKSATKFLQQYKFDGFDLSYRLPVEKAIKKQNKLVKALKSVKKTTTEKVASNLGLNKKKQKRTNINYKDKMTQLIDELKTDFKSNKMMLSLTVMPNVNASKYFNVPAIMGNLDLVNLATFDFSTPYRSSKIADYLAPLQAPPKNDLRNPNANVDSQVRYWLSQGANPKQLNMGIAAYGRTWEIKKTLKSDKMPISSSLSGPAPGDSKIHRRGMWSWSEVCMNVKRMTKFEDKTLGNYAYSAVEVKGKTGLLVTYENVASVTEKASYVQTRGMGGMTLFDLSLDDFQGQCNGDKFALLKAIRYKLI